MPSIDRTLFRAARVLNVLVSYLPGGILRMVLKWAAFAGLAAILRGYVELNYWQTAAGVFAVYLATGGWKFTWVVIRTLPEISGVLLRLTYRLSGLHRQKKLVHDVFRDNVKKHPDKIAFIQEEQKWTFREMDNITSKIGNYFFERGYRSGDAVAIFMDNTPEVVFLWLGLSKIGVVSALINFSLKKEGFAHCVTVSKARALIFSSKLVEVVDEGVSRLSPSMDFFCLGSLSSKPNFAFTDLESVLGSTSALPPPIIDGRRPTDLLLYILTSGTTGLPKGAKITHSRYFLMGLGIYYAYGLRTDDVLYTTIPLYHSAGGIVGVGQVLLNGATMAVRSKFSASRFWDEACKYNATCIQYIGEICRYMLDQPVKPSEKQHRVRVAVGNGLRPQIWKEFQSRFNIPQIAEFYGATEGNSNIVNMDQVPGAVGFTSRIVPWAYPVSLVRVDEDTGEIIRGSNGLCIQANPGEPGELIGKIKVGDPIRDFQGYADESATKKKIVFDVFRKGDRAFLSGDILVMDDYGNFYFRDRAGDTFRWKGENVSTTEVEASISNIVDLSDVCVYGVEIPGTEGKAGMAAIANLTVDLVKLNRNLQEMLPPYARPIFIKLVQSVTVTGTAKFQKTALKKAGFDPSLKENDRVYVMHPSTRQYEPVDPTTYQDIIHGKLRF
ncbi:putative long-chain fatty acid transport protein 4-like [Apostichopus japonicus]|uniref:Very long-chain fatty acid transport protein n=1 Tax=Stichopus japonicus TaxID=307972 RepID=A0A2G8KB60_STIJA|nr:putative long-chain fatty acid transport protein 4-like [Apostichopus japonicus]